MLAEITMQQFSKACHNVCLAIRTSDYGVKDR